MTEMQQNENRKNRLMDWSLLLIVMTLVVLGLIMQYSASSYKLSIVIRQGAYALGGLVVLFVVSFFPLTVLYKLSYFAFGFSILATFATRVIGTDVKGARRWIDIGPISFQPSELLKAALVMTLAAVLCHFFHEINGLKRVTIIETAKKIKNKEITLKDIKAGFIPFFKERRGYILPILIIGVSAAVVAVLTKDLGTAVIIFGIGFCMLLAISPGIHYLITILVLAAIGAVVLIRLQPYRIGRIDAWLHLKDNTSDLGFQIQQGLYAIGSGGWFGRGLGKSIQKNIIPEPHTDMIFTIVCEELGIIGGIIVIILFVLLILRLRKICNETTDLFGKMIVIGVAAHIGIQAVVNMAVMANLIPNTGVPLPFISYGGTSLVTLLVEIGMVMAVRRKGLDRVKNNVYDTGYPVNS